MKRPITQILTIILMVTGFIACGSYMNANNENDHKYIREGSSRYGDIVCNTDGEYIYEGHSRYGDVIYNIDGEYIRKGSSRYGDVVYNID